MIEDLADRHGVLLRREVIAHGYDDNSLARSRRSGALHRVRQGVYVRGSIWSQADDRQRHLLAARGVSRLYDGGVALSHQSACLVHGAPDWGLSLADVRVTSLVGFGERRAALVNHHRGAIRDDDLTRWDGGWVTSPLRTALDIASLASRDAAVSVLDWFLHESLVTREQLEWGHAARRVWPRSLHLHARLGLCDARCESVGETRCRLLFLDHGLPRAQSQWTVRRPDGSVAGRVDFAWPEFGLIVEFDGVNKYLALRRPGESIEAAVLREKAREDEIRKLTGWRVVRLTWADLGRPEGTAGRLRQWLVAPAA